MSETGHSLSLVVMDATLLMSVTLQTLMLTQLTQLAESVLVVTTHTELTPCVDSTPF